MVLPSKKMHREAQNNFVVLTNLFYTDVPLAAHVHAAARRRSACAIDTAAG